MELVFKYIEEKHDKYAQKQLKSDLYYAVAYDKYDNPLGEVNGYYSYCEDCKNDMEEEFNETLKNNPSELDINSNDEAEVSYIKMLCEGSPERDDFEYCQGCYELIYVGVLHTMDQEITHYLGEKQNLHIKHLSDADCYRIHELMHNCSRYKELIEKLKEKIIKQNN
ncbi:hypothetical protein CQS02_20080 [Elizabethkingia miricola]|nr:hypothetical protein CQS02_20080 [Elizabethkingia miricola]